VEANKAMPNPLNLDYEYNDPADPNSFYTRSDHYSYAAKGIPIAFFFTGTHPDYHGPGDHADKILYPKLTKIAQMVYQAGFSVANTDRTLTRDNKGPRAGRGFAGRIEK
jgi:Zn-dependent M28 family amino/carboxypeptidase